jgi:hypothetical protein
VHVTEPDKTKPDEAVDAPPLNPFASWVQEQRGGLLHSELSELLASVTASVIELGKTGSLQLTISITPSKIRGAVEISDKVVAKPAEPDRDAALFYADGTGNLSRRDPRQPELPFDR